MREKRLVISRQIQTYAYALFRVDQTYAAQISKPALAVSQRSTKRDCRSIVYLQPKSRHRTHPAVQGCEFRGSSHQLPWHLCGGANCKQTIWPQKYNKLQRNEEHSSNRVHREPQHVIATCDGSCSEGNL